MRITSKLFLIGFYFQLSTGLLHAQEERFLLDVEMGRLDRVERAIPQFDDPDVKAEILGKALLVASGSVHNQKEMCALLLNHGADIEYKEKGRTALFNILENYDVEMAQWFIEKGADVNVISNDGKTPLLIAASESGNKAVVLLLVEAGANVNVNYYGRTPLMELCSEPGNIEIIRRLIEAGAEMNAEDNKGRTALSEALGTLNREKRERSYQANPADYDVNMEEAREVVLLLRSSGASRTRLEKIGIGVLGFFVLLFGGITVKMFNRTLGAKRWPTTTGIVTKSRVGSKIGRKFRTYYYPYVAYDYQVEDKEYTGDKIYFYRANSNDKGYWLKLVSQYPINGSVNVYYNPGSPEISVLRPGKITVSMIFASIVTLMFLYALIAVWLDLPIPIFG